MFHLLMALLFIRLSANGSGVPGVFGWFFAYWIAIASLSAIVLILRLVSALNQRNLFYVCFGLGSLLTGTVGLFIGIGDMYRDLTWLCLYLITILLGSLMLADTFVFNLMDHKEQPK